MNLGDLSFSSGIRSVWEGNFYSERKKGELESKTLALVTAEEGARTAARIMRLDRAEISEETELKHDWWGKSREGKCLSTGIAEVAS